jgi:hypothetical protein
VNTTQTAIEDMSRELSIDSEEYNLTENPKLIKSMSYYQETINQLKGDVEKLTSFDRSAGIVWAASGERINDNGRFMDWALVSLLPNRPFQNLVRIPNLYDSTFTNLQNSCQTEKNYEN